MKPSRFYHSLRFKIVAALAVVFIISIAGLYYYQATFSRHQLIRILEDSSKRYLSSIIKESLRHSMLARDLTETRNIMGTVREQEEVLSIILVNKRGEVVLAPDGAESRKRFSLSEPTCQVCHRSKSKDRPMTMFLTDHQGREIVRNVSPVLNESTCHGCHDPSNQVLGMLITDYSLHGVDAQLGREFRQLAAVLALSFFLLMGGLSFGFDRLILARLGRVVEAARRFGRGDFRQKVLDRGSDELGELSSAFNQMASDLENHLEELKAMERELSRAEKLASLGVLSRGAAHEILNPLTNISVSLQIFLKDETLSPKVLRICGEMSEEVERIRQVVRGLDAFARKLKGERHPVPIHEVLDKALQSVEEEARQRGIDVEKEFLPVSAPVLGYSADFQQAFANIVDNALMAMPKGGTLSLRISEFVKEGEMWVDVGISDTGVGIRDEHLDKVFDPFFVAWEGQESYKAQGLGLSIALGTIEAHGGSIRVESEVGRGTTVIVQLPL